MIDLNKSYVIESNINEYNGDVIGIFHYPDNIYIKNLLVIFVTDEGNTDVVWLPDSGKSEKFNLKPKTKKITEWFNVYVSDDGRIGVGEIGYSTQRDAHANSGGGVLRQIEIEVEVGADG